MIFRNRGRVSRQTELPKERNGRALSLISLKVIELREKWTMEILIRILNFDSTFLSIYSKDREVLLKAGLKRFIIFDGKRMLRTATRLVLLMKLAGVIVEDNVRVMIGTNVLKVDNHKILKYLKSFKLDILIPFFLLTSVHPIYLARQFNLSNVANKLFLTKAI